MPAPAKEVIELATAVVQLATVIVAPLVTVVVTRKATRRKRRGRDSSK
jgi:hypothetical protein